MQSNLRSDHINQESEKTIGEVRVMHTYHTGHRKSQEEEEYGEEVAGVTFYKQGNIFFFFFNI